MSANLHRRTPSLVVIDSRGLPLRQVAYLRALADATAEALVTRQQHDIAGRLVAQFDPRLSAPSVISIHDLNGQPLKVSSVDAGWRLSLPGLGGQALQRWDARGVHWSSRYDESLRLVAISNSADPLSETFTYADASAPADHNQRGQLLEQVDPSGSLHLDSYSLAGQPLRESRTFADARVFVSQRIFNPLGAMLEQTDAGGHRQQSRYDVAGQLKQLQLLLAGDDDWQDVLLDTHFNAVGQIIEQQAGNGIVSHWDYEPTTGRLQRQWAQKDAQPPLLDISYEYDPVGNPTRILDNAFTPSHFANQRVDGERAFRYDSLYRLISASGYDDAAPGDLPGRPQPSDPNDRRNYLQTYRYDNGGNLTQLCHVRDGACQTRQLRIDPASNRGVRWKEGDPAPDFDQLFDRHGNLMALQPGQALRWDTRDQLASVTLVQRENGLDDAEFYHYSQGARVYKRHDTYSGSNRHFHEVRYLPGLEIRSKDNGEELHVISLAVGSGHVSCLHWLNGKPPGIAANQLRYTLNDHLGSCVMELDQQARLISHEGYYPFGATAWLSADSAVEVDYKTLRYSGKEMDVSGLYYYGARYYAPWLQRWISADPAWDVDGLNLFEFVGNNPLRYFDTQGHQRTSSELLTVVADYENLLATVTKELDKSIYQFNHLNSVKDIYLSSGKKAVLTLLNVLASSIVAATTFTASTAAGTLLTLNPVTGIAIGIGTAALAADITGAQIDKLGEDNSFGYALLPDSADYDVGRLNMEAKPKSWMSKIKSVFSKYAPDSIDGNKEILIAGAIGAADVLTGGTHLEKFLAFFRLSVEVTEALNDSLGQRDLDLVEQGIELVADHLNSRKELSDQALEDLEGLGRENIATAQGTRYRLAQSETAVLGKMNRVLELLPRVSSHMQQKRAA